MTNEGVGQEPQTAQEWRAAYFRMMQRAEQATEAQRAAERALVLVQCCDDEPCDSCVACLQRTVGISYEKIATLRATLSDTLAKLEESVQSIGHLRATLARVEGERDFFDGQNASAMETVGKLADDVERLTAERDGLRAALEDAVFVVEGLIPSIEEQYDPGSRCYDERAAAQRWRAALGRPGKENL